MKVIKVLLIGLLLTVGFVYSSDGKWNKDTCAICCKEVYMYQEEYSNYFSVNDNIFIDSTKSLYLVETGKDINWSKSLFMCDDCAKKYSKEYMLEMTKTYNEWLEKKIKENKDLRKQNILKSKEKETKEIEDSIKKLQEKLKKIK